MKTETDTRAPRERNIDRMVALLAAFQAKHELPSESADEQMLDPTLTGEQAEWLDRYCYLWDEYCTY